MLDQSASSGVIAKDSETQTHDLGAQHDEMSIAMRWPVQVPGLHILAGCTEYHGEVADGTVSRSLAA
jgi:hypothetical protein